VRQRSILGRLNIAPDVQKHPPLSWMLLALGALIAVLSTSVLRQRMQELEFVHDQVRATEKARTRQAGETRKATLAQNSPGSRERDRLLQQIQEYSQLSWDGMLDVLEVAADRVHGGVTIAGMVPSKVSPSSVQLGITALASNAPIMVAYMEALKKDPRVLQAEIRLQQPEPNVGSAVIRFSMDLMLNPQITQPHPVRPVPVVAPLTATTKPDTIIPQVLMRDIRAQSGQPPR
jgi:hypothetical protein